MSDVDTEIQSAVFFEADRRHKSKHGYYDAKVTHGVEEFWMTHSVAKCLVRFLAQNPVLEPSTLTKAVRRFGRLGSLVREREGR